MSEKVINKYKARIADIYSKFKAENISLDNYQLATIFELYCCIFLSQKFDRPFYMYEDLSVEYKIENYLSKRDTGIDFTDQKEFYGQCKLRKESITWTDIGTFLSHLVGTNMKPILCYNSGITFSEQLYLKKHLFELYPFDRNNVIEFCDKNMENIPPKPKLQKTVRLYQIKLKNKIQNSQEKLLINLPTGTGKTVIMSISIEPSKKYLILTPRVILAEQTRDTIIKFCPKLAGKIQLLYSCSKIKTLQTAKDIYICVYNSFPLINTDFSLFEKIFIDEVHHIFQPMIYTENQEDSDNDNDNDNDNDDLELSDTKGYISDIRNMTETLNNVVGFSATVDEQQDWDYETVPLRKMITQGFLCDYEIKFPIFTACNDKSVCEYLIANCVHYILYCENRKRGCEINDLLNKLLPNCSAFIDCNTSKTDREKYFQQYNNGEIIFLVNIRVLTEGFDAPITQGVCLMNIPSTKLLMIQILGRALRKYPNKEKAFIMFPLILGRETTKIAKVLKMIIDNDSKYSKMYLEKQYRGYIEFDIGEKLDCDLNKKQIEMIDLFIEEQVFDSFGNSLDNTEKWLLKLAKVKEFINENKKRPSSHSKNDDEKKLGNWIGTQVKNYKTKSHIMTNPQIYDTWNSFTQEYTEYVMTNEEQWLLKFESVKAFIDNYKKRPTKESKNLVEKCLGNWISDQLTNYKTKLQIMKNPEIYDTWTQFTQEYREYVMTNEDQWFLTFESVREFMDNYKKRPSRNSKNTDENTLARWIDNHQHNYKTKIDIMKNPQIYDTWRSFTQEYAEYVMTNEDQWFLKFESVKAFMDNYKKRPSSTSKNVDEKRLGRWIGTQVTNYNTKSKIMKNPQIYDNWTQFTQEYAEYVMTNEEQWFLTFESVKAFIDNYKKRPSPTSKIVDEKTLGYWISAQLTNYKTKSNIMKNPQIYDDWTQFTQEYAEYFMTNEEQWFLKFESVKAFIVNYKKRPSSKSKNLIVKQLGLWIGTQLKNYKTKSKIMKNPQIYDTWTQFTQEYGIYFNY